MDNSSTPVSNATEKKDIIESNDYCVKCVTQAQKHNTDNTNKEVDNTDNTDNTITHITQHKDNIYNKLTNKQKIIFIVIDKWLNAKQISEEDKSLTIYNVRNSLLSTDRQTLIDDSDGFIVINDIKEGRIKINKNFIIKISKGGFK